MTTTDLTPEEIHQIGLKQLAETCRNGGNVMPVLVDAVKDYVSLGEISDVYRQVFGLYREPIIF